MTLTQVGIPLLADHAQDHCRKWAVPLYEQLSSGYELCSVLEVPEELGDWRELHKTARKRSDRAERRGYTFDRVKIENHEDDIYEINTSLPFRQGRPMSDSYRNRPQLSPDPEWQCPAHRVYRYGVFQESRLLAYLWLYRSGQLALVSSILGHGDFQQDEIMFLLFAGAVNDQAGSGGYFVYNRHDSGTSGLVQFKEWLGFEGREVAWLL